MIFVFAALLEYAVVQWISRQGMAILNNVGKNLLAFWDLKITLKSTKRSRRCILSQKDAANEGFMKLTYEKIDINLKLILAKNTTWWRI